MTLLPLFNSKIHSVFLCLVPRLFPFCCLYFFFYFPSLLLTLLAWPAKRFSSLLYLFKWNLYVYIICTWMGLLIYLFYAAWNTQEKSFHRLIPIHSGIQFNIFFYGFRRKTKKEFFFVKKKRLIVQLKVLFISMSKY